LLLEHDPSLNSVFSISSRVRKRFILFLRCIPRRIGRIYPYAPLNVSIVDPHLAEWVSEITLEDLRVGNSTISIHFYHGKEWRERLPNSRSAWASARSAPAKSMVSNRRLRRTTQRYSHEPHTRTVDKNEPQTSTVSILRSTT